MLAEERLTQIYHLILTTKAVKIDELAQLYQVTPMTIRRDLNKLAGTHKDIRRCHGGAVLSVEVDSEEDFESKKNINVMEKIQVAGKAFALIKDQDTIYLDAGTTTFELAKLIAESELTLKIITNDIEISRVLDHSKCEVLVTGGVMQKSTGCLVGNFAEEFISKIKFKIAFMGATAINESFEVLTPSIEKRTMKPLVVRNSSESYLLVDSDKFNRSSTYLIYNLNDFTGVITTKKFECKEKEKLEKNGIELIEVY